MVDIEPVSRRSPRPLRQSALPQNWRDVCFLHWPVFPHQVAPLLPPGTRPDCLDGVSYVGLVPFRIQGVRLFPGLPMPYWGSFCETNVRLYTVDDQGRRGVVFASLDAAKLFPVLIGRAVFQLPYLWASMAIEKNGNTITYVCQRRRARPRVTSLVSINVGRPLKKSRRLDNFLTARWGLHVLWHGRTLYLPNEHPPWLLHTAELLELDDGLVRAAGLASATGPPTSVLFSPGVLARFGAPRVVV
jgi:uncharacterized protein YqjF (DUF2071 family)